MIGQPFATQRSTDLHRPHYHFLPPANWLNDPNGLIQWQGQYHLFYQYNPFAAVHGTIHWGHAVSPDLVRWQHLPIALAPTPGGPDADGCWSGCAVDDNGVPTLIYSGARDGVQRTCLATSDDNLLTWQKHPGNPVIPEPPALDLVEYRDHAVWREGDTWYQLIGSGIRGQGGTVLLYRSADLRRWEYLHPMLVGDAASADPVWTGTMWECPSFFPLGDKHVLLVSVWDQGHLHYTVFFVGSYENHRFTPERSGKLDLGEHHFYAPQTMQDDGGRRIIFGWLQEGRSVAAQQRAGWSGVMSLPRELQLDADGTLRSVPVAELATLRGRHWELAARTLTGDEPLPCGGRSLEIVAEIDVGDAEAVGFEVCRAPDGTEATRIVYRPATQQLVLDRSRSTTAEGDTSTQGGTLALAPDEPLRLHIFVDHSTIEVFANDGRACISSRIYPAADDSVELAIVARGGTSTLRALDVWELQAALPDAQAA